MLNGLRDLINFARLWPMENQSLRVHFMGFAVNVFIFTYIWVGYYLYMLKTFNDENATFEEILDSVYTIPALTNLLYNYIALTFIYKNSQALYNDVLYFKRFGIPKYLGEADRRANMVSLFLYGYCLVGCAGHEVYQLTRYETCMEYYLINGKNYMCGVTFKVYYPYNYNHGISYLLHVLGAIYSQCFLCSAGVLFVCFCIGFIEYICARIDQLVDLLHEIFEVENDEEQRERLNHCIAYHIYITRLVDQINSCFTPICTPALFNYSITIGLCLFTVMKNGSSKAFLLCVGFSLTGLLLCSYGQKLYDKSLSVGTEAYNIRWYDGNVSLQKDILFMIERGQKPLTLNGGFGVYFHLPIFTQIMRGAYTYMSLVTST